uniref:LINE-1 type transposase domain-containing protein 1 n=1 Tax=Larimichthys crocea TaxID=215358 RepID=A0A0F8AGW2_LARCR
MEVFGEDILDSPPECDRGHRTLSEKLKPVQRVRPAIIRLHRVIREARARRGKLQYRGSPISIYEDYAPEVVAQRQKYREMMSELYNLGFKPALLFPAMIVAVMKDGKRKRFSSVSEAKHFITSIHTEET